ncbi:F0F1 ATP synthase subunit A [bacterium (Candidatus Blackallbacteria) CG17_big_fil_post_rev_8_21_14_2_50_48_46]|uniref:ATP synthase subunit a n=1 Tax=bacterium (Candidatus Blackallbacteria) CG17_big_fil_post_rev_8_21_14_2_50_48_46 TaxID=2014261 RepID=A0A2M7G0Z2_9BACT|nr:MAG: F0F1 ATP synthase subunit A [bacterium (Candidatus Blackallbacteria) CG18_big_fil_WC_8_21_14_2_50_49_26]PIW15359.1 MAG: F0F1 ATP synthase subunit A [bacterium (Candidatus Blackallbacteria) CG17_big_fil_post_rev_8_21_14_2_50_48_46]PIW49780.1 MAG: F0F1 ATP synthase subunit A [bacterium (Candidatus Blackallbacteria) CG13_big_fil_rev_8_21_14_2_50_49_14]
MNIQEVFPQELWNGGTVQFGPLRLELVITDVVPTTLLISVLLILAAWGLTRRLSLEKPGPAQLLVETLLVAMARTVRDFSGMAIRPFFALVATLWIFIGAANLFGTLPFFGTPTRDLGTVVALSTISFGSSYYFGLRFQGPAFLKRFLEPYPFLLPLNLIGELGRILSLTFRLFGNMLGWELIIAILVMLTGVLVPVPMMLFNTVGNLIQAYLFGILSLVYIVSGLQIENLQAPLNEKENWYED